MPCPRYLRVMTVLGERDRDLREWCYHNRRTRTVLIRAALRALLRERGELPPVADGGRSGPAPRAPSRTPAPAVAPRALATPPAPVPAPPVHPSSRPPSPKPAPGTSRSSLRTMLGDFS